MAVLGLSPLASPGCRPAHSSHSQATGSFGATFLGSGIPGSCFNRCWDNLVPLLRAEAGLDPDALGTYDVGRVEELVRSLGAGGGSVRPVALTAMVEGLKPGARTRVLLADRNDHLYLLIGLIEEEGQARCQFLHGDSSVLLLSKPELLAAGFRGAWELTGPPGGAVPVRVGSGSLSANTVLHNFGQVRPEQDFRTTFVLKNTGAVPLVVGKPAPSCSCTTTAVTEATGLAPGETLEVPVNVHTSDTISMRQFVQLTVSERDNYASRSLMLTLTGSQFGAMKVVPRALSFGTVVPGRPVTQTFLMEETTTDRFTIRRVEPGTLPVAHQVKVSEDHHGLRVYQVRCTLRVDESASGRHAEVLSVKTDSRLYPNVSIPVTYEVAPFAAAVPGAVALGEVPVGEPRRQEVRFTSRAGAPTSVEVEEAPAGVTAEVAADPKAGPLLTLTVTLDKPGIWQGVVKAGVRSGARRETIVIPCAAYGKAR
jgi:hypothetical protein